VSSRAPGQSRAAGGQPPVNGEALVSDELVELVLYLQFLALQIGDRVVVRHRASIFLIDFSFKFRVLLFERDDPIGLRHAVFSLP
jgi:hypothetical protein